jgi:hypothetical protein
MKHYALLSVLGIGAALAACTVNSTTNNNGTDGSTGEDGSTSDSTASSSGGDTGTTGETGTSSGGEGGSCVLNVSLGTTACDTCATAHCCTELNTCDTADEAGVDDANLSACDALEKCISDCVIGNAEAGVEGGTPSECMTGCNPSNLYTPTEIANAQAALSCLSTNCLSSCQ